MLHTFFGIPRETRNREPPGSFPLYSSYRFRSIDAHALHFWRKTFFWKMAKLHGILSPILICSKVANLLLNRNATSIRDFSEHNSFRVSFVYALKFNNNDF
ncbi:putative phosphatidylinositide phosphatase SAC2 [Trichinella spiralis]|uniref:putative phosphatidylinositide phosphatase SAC2 n=1 Tax=Trichinella spiralis TaxID=6334 RepID=UPI0001EFE16C|nr:putative phosphatidylinositide phosphatase SAC2 [Trichinella spiralis]